MNLFESILYGLSGKMETPTQFGIFHLVCFGVVILLTVLLCVRFKDATAKTEKILLLSAWGVLAILEIYKQLIYSINFTDPVSWDYQWYSFPFQFCSSPLYLFPLAALPKNERFRDAVRMFLATFSLFAGLAVMFYTNDVFSAYIGINIQTMVHHGAMVIFGVYLGGRLIRENKMTLPCFLRGCAVFVTLLIIALVMNLCAPLVTDEIFNMFYIGPNFPCTLVILDVIYLHVPYILFLLIYTLGFSFAAFLMFCGQCFLRPSWYRSKNKASQNNPES